LTQILFGAKMIWGIFSNQLSTFYTIYDKLLNTCFERYKSIAFGYFWCFGYSRTSDEHNWKIRYVCIIYTITEMKLGLPLRDEYVSKYWARYLIGMWVLYNDNIFGRTLPMFYGNTRMVTDYIKGCLRKTRMEVWNDDEDYLLKYFVGRCFSIHLEQW